MSFVIDMNITQNIHFPLSPVICLHLTSVLSNQRNSSNIAYGSLDGKLIFQTHNSVHSDGEIDWV